MSKKHLFIIPSYVCNFNCTFCSQKTRKDNRRKIDLEKLEEAIEKVDKENGISYITLLGGEVSVLPDKYLDQLMNIIDKYNVDLGIQTNLYKLNPRLLKYNLTISWDPTKRQSVDRVFQNILTLEKFTLDTIVTQEVIDEGAQSLVQFYESLANLKAVGLNFYMTSYIAKNADVQKYVDFLREVKALNPKFPVAQLDIQEHGEKITFAPPLTDEAPYHLDFKNSYEENYGCKGCSMQKYCTLFTEIEDPNTCPFKGFLEEQLNESRARKERTP